MDLRTETRISVLETMITDMMARSFKTDDEMREWTERVDEQRANVADNWRTKRPDWEEETKERVMAAYEHAWDAALANVRAFYAHHNQPGED